MQSSEELDNVYSYVQKYLDQYFKMYPYNI